jgi:hypothetical protein
LGRDQNHIFFSSTSIKPSLIHVRGGFSCLTTPIYYGIMIHMPLTKKINVYLREDQYEQLRKEAFEKRTSIADFIRQAVDSLLASQGASNETTHA